MAPVVQAYGGAQGGGGLGARCGGWLGGVGCDPVLRGPARSLRVEAV